VPIASEEEIVPRLHDFATIGHRSTDSGFGRLVDTFGADRVFVGLPQAQMTQARFAWPHLLPITDLASATGAVEAIVEEGEGPLRDWRQAHFGRFRGIEPLAKVLSTLPVTPNGPGVTGGAPFELFYEPDYFRPHRRPARLLVSERLGEAAALSAHLSETAACWVLSRLNCLVFQTNSVLCANLPEG
jgi:hypothetical protein